MIKSTEHCERWHMKLLKPGEGGSTGNSHRWHMKILKGRSFLCKGWVGIDVPETWVEAKLYCNGYQIWEKIENSYKNGSESFSIKFHIPGEYCPLYGVK